jgi:hypothetical protein
MAFHITLLQSILDKIPSLVGGKTPVASTPVASEVHFGESGFAMNVTAPLELVCSDGVAYTANQRMCGAATPP